jgi:hypothetical protein
MTDHPQAALEGATPKLDTSATLHWVRLGLDWLFSRILRSFFGFFGEISRIFISFLAYNWVFRCVFESFLLVDA